LSTVSTFAVETRTIDRKRWKMIYVLSSVVLGHLLVLAIVGGVKWSREGLGPFCH
jgi:CrcB protein